MWVVIVFPPLVIPRGIRRRDACHRCGARGSVDVHERLTRRLAYFTPLANPAGELPVAQYTTVRFRCRACRATVTPPLPRPSSIGRVPRFHEAKAGVWYRLGDLPSQILVEMKHHDTPISRATLFRVLSRAWDQRLHQLHLANRRRKRRGARRHRAFVWCQGADIAVNEGAFAEAIAARAHVIDRDDGLLAASVVIRSTAVVFAMRRTPMATETLDWIERYLSRIGHAGVLRFRDRVELDRSFRPDLPNPMLRPGDDLVVPLEALGQPLAASRPPVRNAIVSALRIADMDQAAVRTALERGLRWRNARAVTSLGRIEHEGIHEA